MLNHLPYGLLDIHKFLCIADPFMHTTPVSHSQHPFAVSGIISHILYSVYLLTYSIHSPHPPSSLFPFIRCDLLAHMSMFLTLF